MTTTNKCSPSSGVKNPPQFLQLDCRLCKRRFNQVDMHQLWPCLHMFCRECVDKCRTSSKVCPASNCYSPLKLNDEHRWNSCDNDLCPRRLSSLNDLYKQVICQHELCAYCYDEALRKEPVICPVTGCGAALAENDGKEECDTCKQALEQGNYLTAACCSARLCQPCFRKMFEGSAHTPPPTDAKGFRCPLGQCPSQKRGTFKRRGQDLLGIVEPLTLNRCSSNPDCENEVLRNFPSMQECEHEVCLDCLDKMIVECEISDHLPMCPNEQCRLPYRFESVVAMRALLPERAKFFAGLSLELSQGYDVIRDDSVSPAEIPLNYNAKEKHLKINCGVSDDEEGPVSVVFTKSGTLGELIREIRLILRIMPTDKIYGYFVRRGDGDDEQLQITTATVQKPIGAFSLGPENIIIVDTSGIVVAKASANIPPH